MTSKYEQRVFWSDPETKFLLSVIMEKDILKLIAEKKYRRDNAFKIVETAFHNCGFTEKNFIQIDNKWKNLRKLYMKAKRLNDQNGEDPLIAQTFPYYAQLDKILTPQNPFDDDQSTILPQASDSKMTPTKCAEIFYVDGHLKYVCFFCTNELENIQKFEEHLYSTHLNSIKSENESNLFYEEENDNNPTIFLSVEKCELNNVKDEVEITDLIVSQKNDEIEIKNELDQNELVSSEIENVIDFEISEISSDTDLICGYCKMEFKTKKELNNHHFHFKMRKFRCYECKKQICGPHRYQKHMKIHGIITRRTPRKKIVDKLPRKYRRKISNTIYICDICQHESKELWNLKTHIRMHTGEKPFACNQCDRKFAQGAQLKMHIRHFHTKDRPYLCTECGLSYGFLRTLNAHIRRTHEKYINGPQPCPVCSKNFENDVRLKNHMIIHDTRYLCVHCRKTFKHRNDLRVHLKLHSSNKNN